MCRSCFKCLYMLPVLLSIRLTHVSPILILPFTYHTMDDSRPGVISIPETFLHACKVNNNLTVNPASISHKSKLMFPQQNFLLARSLRPQISAILPTMKSVMEWKLEWSYSIAIEMSSFCKLTKTYMWLRGHTARHHFQGVRRSLIKWRTQKLTVHLLTLRATSCVSVCLISPRN